ncbi:hypothetical protein [Streptomyces sp. 6N106]|uniref:hypothetical protein n=1 Tax=Streptomyces sp. 6N106 TaxID=3457418 RepID=UPI003FCF95E7
MKVQGTIMTVRVSRDGGRTFGPVVVHDRVEDNLLPLMSSKWPPCQCRRCQANTWWSQTRHGLARLLVDITAESAGVPEKLWDPKL